MDKSCLRGIKGQQNAYDSKVMARSAAAKYKNEVRAPVKLPVTRLMNK